MRTFARDALIFITINCLIVGLMYARYRVSEDYLAAVNDKLDRLAEVQPPRVLLCGGSSVAWSSHSKIVQDVVGMNVQNVAYHAGLGLSVRIAEVKQLAKRGDVVVMSVEWGVLSDEPRPRIMAETTIACPRVLRFMNWRDQKLAADGLLPAIRMPFGSLVEDLRDQKSLSAFSSETARKRKRWRLRENFNEWGDFTGHYGVKPLGFVGKQFHTPTDAELLTAIDRLNQLHDWCEAEGIAMVFFIPLIPQQIYEQHCAVNHDEPTIPNYVEVLKQQATFPILNPDQVYASDDSFFDSAYHMRDFAGAARTQLLADRLFKHLAQ